MSFLARFGNIQFKGYGVDWWVRWPMMWWEMRNEKTHCAAFVNSGWEHHCRQWITLTSCVLIVTNCKWSSRFLLVLRWCELVERKWVSWYWLFCQTVIDSDLSTFRQICEARIWGNVLSSVPEVLMINTFGLLDWECWISKCPHCKKIWPRDQKTGPRTATWEECTWKSQRDDGEHAKRICESLN